MTSVDWNVFIHTLDTLAEGGFSFVHLDDAMSWHHGKEAVQASVALLSRQGLIRVLKGQAHDATFQEVEAEEKQRLADQFLAVAHDDRQSKANNWLEVTERGEALLSLLGLDVTVN